MSLAVPTDLANTEVYAPRSLDCLAVRAERGPGLSSGLDGNLFGVRDFAFGKDDAQDAVGRAGVDLVFRDVARQRDHATEFAIGAFHAMVVLSLLLGLGLLLAGNPQVAAALATLVIDLPPLRERWQDLPLLVQWMIEDQNARGDKQVAGMSLEALDRLTDYGWPGDVAELSELIRQLHAQVRGPEIAVRDLPKRILLPADVARYAKREDETIVLEEYLGRIERELIDRALARAKGNKTQAARLLGMNRPRFYRRLVQLGYEPPPPATAADD